MSHSTFNEHYLTLDTHFGLHENLTISNRKLSNVSSSIEDSIIDGYKDFPDDFSIGATYDSKPIVRMMHTYGKTTEKFLIVTRNE